MAPDGFLRNVSPSWRREKRPGSWQLLTPGKNGEADAAPEQPDAFFRLQPFDLKVQEIWLNLKNYADSTLEELDVPTDCGAESDLSTEIAWRVTGDQDLRPLASRTCKARRGDHLASYEKGLASMILLGLGQLLQGPPKTRTIATWQSPRPEAAPGRCWRPEPVELLWPEAMFDPLAAGVRNSRTLGRMSMGIKSMIDVVSHAPLCRYQGRGAARTYQAGG